MRQEIVTGQQFSEATGCVFDIQHFSIHDGPGIRSTVFLKGCSLECIWCHNPEGRQAEAVVVFEERSCRSCRQCAEICSENCHSFHEKRHRFIVERCTRCGACIQSCPYGAIHWVGKTMRAVEVLDQVCKDMAYFQASGGGITLSGGEPTMQPEFSLALLQIAGQRGLHRAVETCGYAPWDVYEKMLPHTELFLFDCKETDPVRHARFTGVDPSLIMQNLKNLHDSGARILLRCPLIPGCNDREDHFTALARLCEKLPRLEGIELLPYHALGASKAERLGMNVQPRFETPSKEQVAQWNNRMKALGAPVIDS